MTRLLIRIVTYHLLLMAILIAGLHYFPGVSDYLPVGGLYELSSDAADFSEVLTGSSTTLQSAADREGLGRLTWALVISIALLATQLVMLPISWAYRASYPGKKADRYVSETLFILPIVITAVVLIIKNSLALAFGLAGIVAGVQYRNRLKRPSDAAFLFAAITVGICSGIQAIGVAVVMSLWFCVTVVLIRRSAAGSASGSAASDVTGEQAESSSRVG